MQQPVRATPFRTFERNFALINTGKLFQTVPRSPALVHRRRRRRGDAGHHLQVHGNLALQEKELSQNVCNLPFYETMQINFSYKLLLVEAAANGF